MTLPRLKKLPSLIITDIDGTLVNAQGELPLANQEALVRAHEMGVPICLATGRRWTTCLRLIRRLELEKWVDWLILNNGMVIRKGPLGPVLLQKNFDASVAQMAIERLESIGLEPIILGHSVDGNQADVFWKNPCLLNQDFVDKNPDHSLRLVDWSELGNKSLAELILIGDEFPLTRAQESLKGLPLETALIRNTFYQGFMLEITPEGASKATGAAFLASHLGLQSESILALGDSANDLPLLKWAGHSGAMAHAPPEVQQAAVFSTSAGDNGVAEAINRYLDA